MCRVLTLLYHRVNHLEYDKNLLAVSPVHFYEQMSYLKQNYPIIRLEEDWSQLDRDAVCITFDDGYMDNFTNALPILQDLEIPATVFVTTGVLNTSEEFWWDELERILLDRKSEYKKTFTLEDEVFSCQWSTKTFEERDELYDTLHWLMYDKISVDRRKDWFRQLRDWRETGSLGRNENLGLQTDQIKWQVPLLTIGAHTVNHPSLKNLSVQEQHYEIRQSINDIEKLLGQKVETFSYPFGTKNDFDQTTIELCKKEYIQKAVANVPGLWDLQCDEYQIPRNIVRDWGIEEFRRKIEGFWNFYRG